MEELILETVMESYLTSDDDAIMDQIISYYRSYNKMIDYARDK